MTTPSLSIIAPAFNERANILPLTQAIAAAMGATAWELIIVDDDSPDGTADEVRAVAAQGFPIRCIRRIGRRGLASAVVEGALAAEADFIAVIDADMQHDERLLPTMLRILREDGADLVIGSRYLRDGDLGDWSTSRRRMSSFANWVAQAVLRVRITDPMSGFFAVRRDVFHACLYDLSQQGYKVLLDIITASPRQLSIVELPYQFRTRSQGESKVDLTIIAEFLFLLVEKVTGGLIPPKFVLFCLVGGIGLLFHLFVLEVMRLAGSGFGLAQLTATYSAMTLNFVVNNAFTYRSQRLRGTRFLLGYVLFCAVCSVGALANIGVATLVLAESGSWPVAGIAGAFMSAVFNFGGAKQLVWRDARKARRPILRTAAARTPDDSQS
jgi:dolichol-phosphate mannosyltransferase